MLMIPLSKHNITLLCVPSIAVRSFTALAEELTVTAAKRKIAEQAQTISELALKNAVMLARIELLRDLAATGTAAIERANGDEADAAFQKLLAALLEDPQALFRLPAAAAPCPADGGGEDTAQEGMAPQAAAEEAAEAGGGEERQEGGGEEQVPPAPPQPQEDPPLAAPSGLAAAALQLQPVDDDGGAADEAAQPDEDMGPLQEEEEEEEEEEGAGEELQQLQEGGEAQQQEEPITDTMLLDALILAPLSQTAVRLDARFHAPLFMKLLGNNNGHENRMSRKDVAEDKVKSFFRGVQPYLAAAHGLRMDQVLCRVEDNGMPGVLPTYKYRNPGLAIERLPNGSGKVAAITRDNEELLWAVKAEARAQLWRKYGGDPFRLFAAMEAHSPTKKKCPIGHCPGDGGGG